MRPVFTEEGVTFVYIKVSSSQTFGDGPCPRLLTWLPAAASLAAAQQPLPHDGDEAQRQRRSDAHLSLPSCGSLQGTGGSRRNAA